MGRLSAMHACVAMFISTTTCVTLYTLHMHLPHLGGGSDELSGSGDELLPSLISVSPSSLVLTGSSAYTSTTSPSPSPTPSPSPLSTPTTAGGGPVTPVNTTPTPALEPVFEPHIMYVLKLEPPKVYL